MERHVGIPAQLAQEGLPALGGLAVEEPGVEEHLGQERPLETRRNRIVTDDTGKTSRDRVWAAGDGKDGGGGTVVRAVAEGRDAARAIVARLEGGAK